jgi:excisionase family DNA binding protein
MPNTRVRILTVSELSKYLHVHKTTIYRALREGKLPGFRVRGDWRSNVDAIEQWLPCTTGLRGILGKSCY